MLSIVSELKNLFLSNNHNSLILDAQNNFGDYGERLLESIIKNIPQHSYYNQTDWNYSTCFSFNIILEEEIPYYHISHAGLVNSLKKLESPLYQVCFDISAVMKFYQFIFVSSELVKNGKLIKYTKSLKPFKDNHISIINLIEKTLKENGYSKVDENILSLKMYKVRLDLANKNEATVYNCLFHDSYGDFSLLENESMFFEEVRKY